MHVRGVSGSARSLMTAILAQNDPRSILCIASDEAICDVWAEEVEFFCTHVSFPHKGEQSYAKEVLVLPRALPRLIAGQRVPTQACMERLQGLLTLCQLPRPVVVIASLSSVLERVISPKVLREHLHELKEGAVQDREGLVQLLIRLGYRSSPLVENIGEFAVRGGLIDVYPLTAPYPFRVEFIGDLIDTIRMFDPETQRSIKRVPEAHICQVVMVPSDAYKEETTEEKIRGRAFEVDAPPQRLRHLVERLRSGQLYQDQALFLPYLSSERATIFDYLPEDIVILAADPITLREGLDSSWKEHAQSVEDAACKGYIIPTAQELYCSPDEVRQLIEPIATVTFHEVPGTCLYQISGDTCGDFKLDTDISLSVPKAVDRIRGGPSPRPHSLASEFGVMRQWIEQGEKVFLVCSTAMDCERLGRLLIEYGLSYEEPQGPVKIEDASGGLYVLQGRIGAGFLFPPLGMVVLTEEDLFGPKLHRPKERVRSRPFKALDVRDLRPGDYVVHRDFGIGLYKGLETLDIRGYVNDYLHLEYAGGDKLYLPVDRTSRIQRYVSTEDTPPPLDKLGGTTWIRTKQRVKASIMEMAEELVSLYVTRMVKKGFSFSKPDALYEEFERLFPFEETPDQKQAIQDVLEDMERDRPMDRLVCGDVGFGKTEVAIRAAFKAVMDGKQTAVLVPTTVLAQQHYVNFKKRFEQYPVTIEMLSRFRSRADQKRILDDLAKGKLDIVIGTHRLLQRDVVFKDLGLLIVDEEQRFGVKQKERLKQYRTQIDVLTLTATPIPRTLQMALLNIRDLSVISTPPQGRRSVETYIVPFSPDIIRAAVLREVSRGGQVFFLHNQVYNIESVAARLREIVPEVRIAVAHGQMPERQLERIMVDFVDKAYDVLVCTTIIENGLDIPNANTIIIHRADRFGLAQLYQIRGRVGRAHQQAYAYLIVPEEDRLSSDARRRIEVLEEFRDIGSGFRVARYDLEIRGAGNLLGPSQSGHIKAVGYDLYMELVEKAIRSLQGEEVVEELDPEIHLDMPAYVPETYIQDQTQRLMLYKRLSSASDRQEIDDLRAEMTDRYGPFPEVVRRLFQVMEFKVELRALRIKEARFSDEGLLLWLDEHSPIDVDRLLAWIAKDPDRLRLFPDHRLWVTYPGGTLPREDLVKEGCSILEVLRGVSSEEVHVCTPGA